MSVKPLTRLTFLKRSAGATAVVGGAMAAGRLTTGADASGVSPQSQLTVGTVTAVRSQRLAQVEVDGEQFEIQLGRSAVLTRGLDGSVADLSPFSGGELVAFAGPRDGSNVIATRVDLVETAGSPGAGETRSA